MNKRLRKSLSLLISLLLCLLLTAAAYADSANVIAAFEPLGDAATVETQFKLARVTLLKRFPAELSIRLEGQSGYQPVPVTWECAEDYDETLDAYHFTPVFEGYTLAEGVKAPEITVVVLGESVTPPLFSHPTEQEREVPILGITHRDPSANLASYNSYESGRLPAVRDQNPYGTCWAFAAIGSMEADLIANGTGTDIDLSELHLAWFANNPCFDEKGCNIGDSYRALADGYLDNGGNTYMAVHTLSNLAGAAAESSVPYRWASDYTPDDFEGRAYKDAQLISAYSINGMDIAGIKSAIYEHGGIAASICWDNAYYSYDNNSFYCPFDDGTNHAVMLVGWDDHFPKENFRLGLLEEDGAWLVRNSWGLDDYGREGYFWMSYYDLPSSLVIKTAMDAQLGQYDHCYAFDSVPYFSEYFFSSTDSISVAEHFTVDGGEQISAVGFDLLQSETSVEIELSLGGKSVYASAQYIYPGYYTITFPEPLVIPQRSDVTLTITCSANGPVSLPVEATYPLDFGRFYSDGYCGSGGFEVDGIVYDGDLRVKLFTTDCDMSGEGVRIVPENFPDNAFRSYVSSSFDADRDGFLSNEEIAAVTYMDLSAVYPSADMDEEREDNPWANYFSVPEEILSEEADAEEYLLPGDSDTYDSPGSFSSLAGLEYFTSLETLICTNKRLTSLDLSANTALQVLVCSGNMLTSLDLSANTALQELYCWNNRLESLDLSRNTALHTLDCSDNMLTELDVSASASFCALVENTVPVLNGRFITFDNGDAFLNYSVGVSLTPSFSLGTGLAVTPDVFPDSGFLDYVANYFDMDRDGTLSDYEISQVKEIVLPGSRDSHGSISSLKGVELFTNLEILICSYNPVSQLDVSANSALLLLQCRTCDLEQLDLRANADLLSLVCLDNPKLSSLDISNCSQLVELVCANCALEELSLEGCSALQTLYCYNNPLTQLDVSGCTALVTLSCFGCQMEELSLTSSETLENLYCYGSPLKKLDVSGCSNLVKLYCYNNLLTELDVSGCTSMSLMSCFGNPLESLDLSGCSSLERAYCYDCTDLRALDVSGCYDLRILYCFDTQLSALDLTDCLYLYSLYVYSTPDMVLDISPCSSLCYLYNYIVPRYDAEYDIFYYSSDNMELYYDADDIIIDTQPDLILPDALATIGEEAFAGGIFRYVVLSENTRTVDARAFAECWNLAYILIPNKDTVLDNQAFGDLSYLVVFGQPDSTAETFAQAHGFTFVPIRVE